MNDLPFTILAIFAHPDDEIGVGSTLAFYHDRGVRTVLICASRGEAATIYCDDCATRENLAEVRTRELECACAHLGIAELRWLDWPDGGIKELPRTAAIGQVVAQIRAVHPDVILTHPENGLYPHPDHLAVWEIVAAAFAAAADPEEYPAAGAPWAAARLFTRAIPQSFFEAVPEFAQYRIQLNGQQLPFLGTPDDQIDVTMHVAPWVERRMAAWDRHRSQHNPAGAFSRMPEEAQRVWVENEHFVLAAARVPLPAGVADDLLAGLEKTPDEPLPAPDAVTALRTALAVHRAYLAVYEDYLGSSPEPQFAALLQGLTEREQELIHLLARGLRRAGETATEIPADPRIKAQSRRQRDPRARLQFLLDGARQAVTFYRAARATEPAWRAVWEELAALAEAQLAAVQTYTP
jgi:mycothiol S-conjugate amidase